MARQQGGQTGGFFGGLRKFCLDNRPPIWKLYGNALNLGAAQAVNESGAFLVAREVRGDQFDPSEPLSLAVERALRYADLVISRAGQFGPLVNAWEFYNEPVINISFPDGSIDWDRSISAAHSLNAAQIAFSNRLHANGLKVVAYNLARGNPHYELFPILAGGCAASDYLGLHAYGAPYYETDAQNQSLRYRRLYASLPLSARRPIIFTEHGCDWNGGGFRLPANDTPTNQFFFSMDWWANETAKDSYVFGSVAFVVGADSGRWQTFEIAEDDSLPIFANLVRKDYNPTPNPSPPNPNPPDPTPIPPIPIPPENPMSAEQERIKAATNSIGRGLNANGIVYVPSFAFPQFAASLRLGPPLGEEYRYTNSGYSVQRAGQAWRDAIIECADDDFAHIKAYNWGDGKEYNPAPTPPTQKRLTTADVSQYGFRVESFIPQPGQKFFGLVAIGNIQSGAQVGTTSTMNALTESGGAAIGYKLTHAYDSVNHKFEKHDSPSVGIVLGTGSYIGPNGPQDRFYVSKDDGAAGSVWPTTLGDVLVAGMPFGEHWQATYTWMLMTG